MSSLSMAGAIFGVMLLLMALRVPIAISMFAAGVFGYISQVGWLPGAGGASKTHRRHGDPSTALKTARMPRVPTTPP